LVPIIAPPSESRVKFNRQKLRGFDDDVTDNAVKGRLTWLF